MTLQTSHKRGFVLEKYIEISIAKFLCTTGSTLFKYSSKLRQRFFCQGELLDVKDWNWTWCRANFLDACSLLKIIWHIFNFYCHCHPTGWFQIMANSKAHFALNMSQCTYSAGWYRRRVPDFEIHPYNLGMILKLETKNPLYYFYSLGVWKLNLFLQN